MTLDLGQELEGLQHTLGFHMQRHGVLAGNLANADTPGFVPMDLSFSEALEGQGGQLAATNGRHIGGAHGGGGAGGEVTPQQPSPALDHNGVQVEHTLAQVTANRLRYETGIELTRRRMALLRYAAQDGGGQ
jgi:flagellar basal-body rod protein FlgB